MAQRPADEQPICRTGGDDSPFGAFIGLLWGGVISMPFWIVVAVWVWA